MDLYTLPTPYPDETWYSIVSRYHRKSGNTKSTITSRELFGGTITSQKKVNPLALDNTIVDYVRLHGPTIGTAEECFSKYTLAPYQMRYYSEKRKEEVLERIFDASELKKTFVFTNHMYSRKQTMLRYCPLCLQEDIEKYGEAYWHRAHQIWVMDKCHKHGCNLLDADMSLSKATYHFTCADEISCPNDKVTYNESPFDIELQDHGLDRDFILKNQLVRIANETGIPMTVANDVHYKNLEMKRKRDIVAALRFQNLTLEDVASQPGNDQLYFKSDEQMMQLFADVPDAIENTNRIAEACNVFYKKEMHLPEFVDTVNGYAPAQYLRKMAKKNVIVKYPDCKQWTPERQKAFKERLYYELGVIEKMGYSSYISIVEDFIRYTKENFGSESVGPGRGSGAGSLVCYLIGITNIDPLKYNLIFERFLNPERVSMPKQYWAPIVNPITQGCAV